MIDRRNHRELLTLWGIKNDGTGGPSIKDLTGSWNCPHCTYINTLNLYTDICMACSNVCASRRHAVRQQQLLKENLAGKAAELLSQQDELLKDLNDDDNSDDEQLSLDILEEAAEIMTFRSIAPVAAGMQLHLILLPDLLLDCLSFLQNPLDIMNVMLVCKLFSSVAGDDMLWWRFQSRFINDPSSDYGSDSLASPTLLKSVSSLSSVNDENSHNSLQTWVCSRCQLTQALATSTHCEMCLSERDLSSDTGPLTSISSTGPTGFIIVKSAEHLAALWIEGSKNYRDVEDKLSGTVDVTSNSDSSKLNESAICSTSKPAGGSSSSSSGGVEDPLTQWAWHVGLPGTAFIIERSRALHTVRSHSLTEGAGKWFYRCKMACLEREYRQLWQSIHRGWEWIRNDLRSRLRQKWLHVYVNDGTDGESESVCTKEQDSNHVAIIKSSYSIPPVSGEQREKERRISTHEADQSYRAYHTCEESAEYVRAIRSEAEALRESLKASETLRKALRKLTSLDWVLCYESIKAELSLQAEALALDLKALWDTLSRNRGDIMSPPLTSSSSSSSSSVSSSLSSSTAWSLSSSSSSSPDLEQPIPPRSILSCQTFLSKLNRACVVFISWANELEENSVSLNDEIAKDKDIYRDTIGLSTKAIDEHTGLPLSQGTPSISNMALIALRNHGLLSHWIVDSTLQCMAVVGAHAEAEGEGEDVGVKPKNSFYRQRAQDQDAALMAGDTESDRDTDRNGVRDSVGESLRRGSIVSIQSPADSMLTPLGTKSTRKRNIADVTPSTEFGLPEKILKTAFVRKEITTAQRKDSVNVLLNLYDLCEVLDVEDDLLSSEKSTQTVFKRRYMHFLCSLPSLASSIRTRNSELDVQAFRNRSNQWEGDDIHFSYSRDIGSCREGPFDPRRDRKIGPSGCIGDDQHLRDFSTRSRGSELTTHVLKVSAISSSEIFHLDFDPKSIRRKQLMGLYG